MTQGNRLIRLEKNEQVIGIAPVIEEERSEDDDVKEEEKISIDNTSESKEETEI